MGAFKNFLLSAALALGLSAGVASANEDVETAGMADTSIASTHNFDIDHNFAGTALDGTKHYYTSPIGFTDLLDARDNLQFNLSEFSNLGEVEDLWALKQNLNSMKPAQFYMEGLPRGAISMDFFDGKAGTFSVGMISNMEMYMFFNPLRPDEISIESIPPGIYIDKDDYRLIESYMGLDLGVQLAYAYAIPVGPANLALGIRTRHYSRLATRMELHYPSYMGFAEEFNPKEKFEEEIGLGEDAKKVKNFMAGFKHRRAYGLDFALLIDMNDPFMDVNAGLVFNNVKANLRNNNSLFRQDYYCDVGLSLKPFYWIGFDGFSKAENMVGFDRWELAFDTRGIGVYPIYSMGWQMPLFDGTIIPRVGYKWHEFGEGYSVGVGVRNNDFQFDFAYVNEPYLYGDYEHDPFEYIMFSVTFGKGLKR